MKNISVTKCCLLGRLRNTKNRRLAASMKKIMKDVLANWGKLRLY